MENYPYKAYVVGENPDGSFQGDIQTLHTQNLPANNTLIAVEYSSLNYKDALSASGHKGITRKFPHTPGIDAAGTIVQTESRHFNIGDKVIVTGYDLGMNTAGGFGAYIRVPDEWVVPLPAGISLVESMLIGTAGFTAALSLYHILAAGANPLSERILVSGATGGVGSLSVHLAKRCGFEVEASTGKAQLASYLTRLGASKVLSREDIFVGPDKALVRPRWQQAIDTVGGSTLGNILKAIYPHGSIAVCGNVQSSEISLTVYPFLLNGAKLIGINSATTPMPLRLHIWDMLANQWKPDFDLLEQETIGIGQLEGAIKLILQGQLSKRIVVKHP